ncbi:4'-phosphopantetheinyl transferase superfamily protein [Spirosoma knui]
MEYASVRCRTLTDFVWHDQAACFPSAEFAVFRLQIPDFAQPPSPAYDVLSADEWQRARRYRRTEDHCRFVYARALLRVLLGTYTGLHPGAIRLAEGANKKPYLPNYPALHFNVSHSGCWVLIAVGAANVGIDVEYIKADFPIGDVMAHSFTADERAYIEASEVPQDRFCQLWTRKEALVKATAKGLDDDFVQIPALDGVHQVASTLLSAEGNWQVAGFTVAEQYLGAVAYNATWPDPKFYTVASSIF